MSSPSDILHAHTLEEIWSLPYPRFVAPLEKPELLKAFYSPAPEAPTSYSIGIKPFETIKQKNQGTIADTVMAESIALLQKDASAVHPDWYAGATILMSGRQFHGGGGLHTDVSIEDHNPVILNYYVPTFTPTLAVPHDKALEIATDYKWMKDVLTADLRQRENRTQFAHAVIGRITRQKMNPKSLLGEEIEFVQRIRAALVPLPLDTMAVATEFTLHTQQRPVHPERVFFRGDATFVC